jgi:acyl-coenzyme A synthetase/AMP-(fatty) acid ligase
MTVDYIAFHAAERPDAIAVITDGREISYAQFARDIRKLTRALREFELRRGAKVVINVEDEYFRWLLLLACERLCVVTLAAPQLSVVQTPLQQHHVEGARFLAHFDFALTEKKLPAESIRRQYEITPEWLQGVLAREDKGEESMPAQGPDDPLRILLTSGTTGIPKKLLYSRRVHEGSITKMMWFANFTPQSRYLGEGNVAAPTACMRAGGTVVFKNSPRMTAEETIASYSITHIVLTPIALKRLLDELPSGFAKRTGLKVFSSGAALSTALRDQACARLASEVYDIYGSYEAGYVSSIGDGGEIGSVWPGVQVQVVSDHDEPMPLGEMGRIRVKTDRMVQGYLDDPEATGRMFKDGWFYAQDSGILHGGHRLQVIGRSDDMINISGSKISPNMLEDLISKIDGIGDVGVCSILNADGIEEIFIAAVAGAQVSNQELAARIKRALALGAWPYGRVHTFRVSQVPRSTNGKIQRKVLQNTLAGLRSALS